MFHFPVPKRPPIRTNMPSFVYGEGVYSAEEIDRINAIADGLPAERVVVGKDLTFKPDGNRSHFRQINPTRDHQWIYQKLADAISILNANTYQFDITGTDEPLYHVTYDGDEQGHYAWHSDVGNDKQAQRKLSITFQMSDAEDYEGGDLEFNAAGQVETAPKKKGQLILFPSYVLHRVAPVTKGVRRAMVAWIVGPPFK